MQLNKQGYTLSEFIILIILVGVFAGFLFVFHVHREATVQAKEVEQVLRAVRYAQEERCFAGEKYEIYATHLKTFLKQKAEHPYFSYDLSSGEGIKARNKFYGYTLQMPSYTDGRICCDDCRKINRHYSPCARLQARKDFVKPDPDCTYYSKAEQNESAAPISQPKPPQESSDVEQKTEEQKQAEADEARLKVLLAQQGEVMPESLEEKPVEKSETAPGEVSSAPAQEQQEDVSACPVPQQGLFYIKPCDAYQAGTQGAVMFTWNKQTCQYDVEQNCLVPATWKAKRAITRVEKGVYPSDLEHMCENFLKENGCEPEVIRDKECFAVNHSCYTKCEVTDQKELPQSASIVLYDVTLKVRELVCSPSKNVTVEIQ